jgi:hypothetical protein
MKMPSLGYWRLLETEGVVLALVSVIHIPYDEQRSRMPLGGVMGYVDASLKMRQKAVT